ncbi:DUF1552 domain-containing protein [Candidatus Entotheonella palauensis]|uniref:DUF1552 domain-containing protein n=1 Tax=Candidatus Entotheonella palauensis TaxID=93172 RepID=UPI0015C4BA1B|nr:DUF1552 domain-containing protein [Candidatus Entotheonella palauensis]
MATLVPLGMGVRLRPVLAGTAPKRVVFFYIPDGCIPTLWHPSGSEFDFTLSQMTEPLAAVKDHCVFVSGLNMYEGGATHEGGIAKVLTGNGPTSLDVFLSEQLGSLTSLSSLLLGVASSHENGSGYFSYLPGRIPRTPQDNPVAAFESVFGSHGGGGGGPNPQLSVLDSALADLNSLRSRLGSIERAKLDLHLSALREVETRLNDPTNADALGCSTSEFNQEGFTVPEGYHGYPRLYNREEHFELVGKLQMDLAALALSCDMTRVLGLQWSHPVSPTRMAWTGSSQRHHDASHYGHAGSATAANFILLQRWYMDQLRYFIDQLSSRPDGDGTLLDNTLILVFSELGDGNLHNHKNMPFILAGGAGGTLSTGRYLHYGGDAHTKLLVSIANAMDVNISTFGYSGHGTGGLNNLLTN